MFLISLEINMTLCDMCYHEKRICSFVDQTRYKIRYDIKFDIYSDKYLQYRYCLGFNRKKPEHSELYLIINEILRDIRKKILKILSYFYIRKKDLLLNFLYDREKDIHPADANKIVNDYMNKIKR